MTDPERATPAPSAPVFRTATGSSPDAPTPLPVQPPTLLAAAQAYLLHGRSVFVTHQGGKHDKTPHWDLVHTGYSKPSKQHPEQLVPSWKPLQTALPTEAHLHRWFAHPQGRSLAIVTGQISGLIVIDTDTTKMSDMLTEAGLRPHVQTGGGGYHFYFRHPGWPVRTLNSKNSRALAARFPGLDLRGDGGYVIAPPSRSEKGLYVTLRDLNDLDDITILPDDLREVLGLFEPTSIPTGPVAAAPRIHSSGPVVRDMRGRVQNDVLLERALDQARAGDGRNNAGAWLAMQLRDNGYTEGEAETVMITYAQQVPDTNPRGQNEPYTISESLRTLGSIYASSAREPWRAPGAQSARAQDLQHPTANEVPSQAGRAFTRGHNLTDVGNGERLVVIHGQDLRYAASRQAWLVWDGARWRVDPEAAKQKAKAAMRTIWEEADAEQDDDRRKKVRQWARTSESRAAVTAALWMAASEPGMGIQQEQLDKHPMLLNVRNGTLDLTTGQLLPHTREHLITKLAGTRFDPHATCPTWMDFIDQVFAADAALIRFIQSAVGYTLTASTAEQCLFLPHGKGSNGKSTFLAVLSALLADYAMAANSDAFLSKRTGGIPNDIAALVGARLVTAVEVDEDRRLAEGLIKQITGGDAVSARFLHAEFFVFQPAFKLWLATNHKPDIRGTDHGIWRRIKLVPFGVEIRKPDQTLLDRLKAELPGILNWALEGCLQWQREGLIEPDAVSDATGTYRSEMNLLGEFVADCCVVAPGQMVNVSELYREYQQWFSSRGEKPVTYTKFGDQIEEQGFKRHRLTSGPPTVKGKIFFLGMRVRLRSETEGELADPAQ